MQNKYITLGIFTILSFGLMSNVYAEAPMIINDLGAINLRSNTNIFLDQKRDESIIKYSLNKKDAEENATESCNESSEVPTATNEEQKNKKDVSLEHKYGINNPEKGVNATKTIYTDDLGRLHFFGKGNLIKSE